MTKHVRSSVWNFFEKDDDPNYAMCLMMILTMLYAWSVDARRWLFVA